MSVSLYIWLTAEKHPAEGQFLQGALNSEESLKLRASARIPVISSRDRQHLKNMNEHKQKIMHQAGAFYRTGYKVTQIKQPTRSNNKS